ncbi:acyl-coenzyme A thioesterase THEM4 isoform X4 [Carcharodon carcharias]|uniref:acyl-coenzyme A thioesterase THEM4 isoform X4 n=1 Tax=Carcharodon carcharias TaxID=13397 RepID=UPI001B7E002A|nr:acyl-coenzyme A thioesterase THEM4 isoform X4 [Carcharodon carcharias]
MMRLGILNRLCRSAVFCSDWTVRDGVTTTMLTLVRNHHVPSDRFKDYGIPNASWNPDMMALYRRYMAWTEDGSWKRLPSYNRALRQDRDPESPNRLFTRNTDVEGSCFEYAMFLNASERRILCIFQPGPLLEGPPCPVPLGSTVLIEARIERVVDRKIFMSCLITSGISPKVHVDGSMLFIKCLGSGPANGK